MEVQSVEYMRVKYTNLKLWAKLDTGYVDAGVVSMNPYADFDIGVEGQLDQSQVYDLAFDGDVRSLDLHALNLSDSVMDGTFAFDGHAR